MLDLGGRRLRQWALLLLGEAHVFLMLQWAGVSLLLTHV